MDFLGALENFFGPTWPAVWTLTKILAIVAPLMLCVAYLTLAERKVIGWMQVRIGPNRVTFFGIRWLGGWAQPIADGDALLAFLNGFAPPIAATGIEPAPAGEETEYEAQRAWEF